MNSVHTELKTENKNDLKKQFNWFYGNFWPALQFASNDFFDGLFSFKLISVSKNINILFQGDDYFVTKVRIDKQHDVFFRCSESAVRIILDNTLGATNKAFEFAKITELETKIISSFSDFLYNRISNMLLTPPSGKRKNMDTVHLTFFIKSANSEESGKFILSLPDVLLNPDVIQQKTDNFNEFELKNSKVEVNIKIGTTKFSLKDIKQLEKEDIVVFENSNIQLMKLLFNGYEKDFRITPNPAIMQAIDNNDGGNKMEETSLSQNLWDNIQVEMEAEFDKIKITLGELKNIEQGLVVDISPVYNNKISLKVENKVIAKGELIIINDRYGVKIDEVYASQPAQVQEEIPQQELQQEFTEHDAIQTPPQTGEEEFDYSDFELDDQDI